MTDLRVTVMDEVFICQTCNATVLGLTGDDGWEMRPDEDLCFKCRDKNWRTEKLDHEDEAHQRLFAIFSAAMTMPIEEAQAIADRAPEWAKR